MTRIALVLGALVWMLTPAGAAAATLHADTIDAWNAYVTATEARIARELAAPSTYLISDGLDAPAHTRACIIAGAIPVAHMVTSGADGEPLPIPDGLVSHWRGSVYLPGVRLDDLLHRLQHPDEDGPHQEDVVRLHVLDRGPSRLSLFIRMARRSIVSVTYDTEHDVVYAREGLRRASSRSVATRIVEVEDPGTEDERPRPEGDDHGFLWRLNSYWRYEETSGGVIVELESLTLSRDIPFGLGPLVRPIVEKIARESMTRTLASLRQTYASPDRVGDPSCG